MAIKEFRWHGKSEEELTKMDLAEFIELIPARQRRSLKRGFTEAQKKLVQAVERKASNIKTHCRDMIIIPSMIGQTVKVYNGKEFVPVLVTAEMVSHYLGEFSQTRKGVIHSSAGIGATRSSKAVSAK